MLDKIIDVLDDFDFDKAVKVVDMVWDDCEKIKDAVDLVWDNRDNLMEVIEFMRENQERLMNMIDHIPDLLDRTGETISAAGGSAIKASAFLTGDDDSFSARELAELAATALVHCFEEMQQGGVHLCARAI